MSEPSAVGQDAVELAGGRARYCDDGRGRLVIALHGVPGHIGHLKELAASLADSARVVRVNLPGFGGTPAAVAKGTDAEAVADYLAELCEALDLEPALVVAHSMGAVFAAALAVRHPERVHTVALLGSMGSRAHRSLSRCGIPFDALAARLDDPDQAAGALAEARRHFERIRFRGLDDEAVRQTVRIMARVDFGAHAERLRQMQQPALIAWANDDESVEAELAEEVAAAVPMAHRYNFKRGGHHLHRTRAPEVADAILAWLYADTAGGRF